MDEIIELAEKHSLHIIEDACQSLGSIYKKKLTGTLGMMGCFSLYASKVLTCGEGGAVATNNDNLADKLKMIRNHGMVEGYDTRILGLNLRLPELSAAIAKAQMSKLQKMLDSRRKNAELLTKLLFPIVDKSNIRLPEETDEKKFNWYLYTVAFQNNGQRDQVKERMINDKIGVTVYYDPPVHKTPYYETLPPLTKNNLSKTNWASEHVLSLPVHPFVTEQDIERIAQSIRENT
jgi:dTDP-4-amino-4,6-dideoxygalactose transaminase